MKRLFPLLLLLNSLSLFSQQVIPLYPGAIPNSKLAENLEELTKDNKGYPIIRNISIPTLSIFLPSKKTANGTAVIICPGGGYWVNAIKHEGTDVAKEFVKKGVAAFVLKYRIPDDRTMLNTSIGPLQDAEQAMEIVRGHAQQWNIDTARVGIMGFSAGAHLASTLGTHYRTNVLPGQLQHSSRPDFMILAYPVITTDSVVNNKGLAAKLLGAHADSNLLNAFSNEKKVDNETPPVFLMQSTDDELSVKNSVLFYEALIANKVPVEMHLFQNGGHGYGMNNATNRIKWMDLCFSWMESNGWLKKNSN
jgi:acetyl esterase/lipase